MLLMILVPTSAPKFQLTRSGTSAHPRDGPQWPTIDAQWPTTAIGHINFVAKIHLMPEYPWQCLNFLGTGQFCY